MRGSEVLVSGRMEFYLTFNLRWLSDTGFNRFINLHLQGEDRLVEDMVRYS